MALVQYVHVLALFTMKSTELHITRSVAVINLSQFLQNHLDRIQNT